MGCRWRQGASGVQGGVSIDGSATQYNKDIRSPYVRSVIVTVSKGEERAPRLLFFFLIEVKFILVEMQIK